MLHELKRCTLPRNQLITASEVAAIVGVSPWQTQHDVWLNKKQPKQQETAAMRRGTAAESVIHTWVGFNGYDGKPPVKFEEGLRYGDAPIQGPVEWAGASPDAAGLDANLDFFLVEFKTSSQPWFGGIPPHYLVQVRWQLLCVPQAQYVVLVGVTEIPAVLDAMLGSNDPHTQTSGRLVLEMMLEAKVLVPQIYIVGRNVEEEQALLQQVSAWYDRHIALDIEPELEARDLGSVQRTWMALESPQEIEVDDEVDDGVFTRLAGILSAADAAAKEAEDAAKKARAELLSYWARNYGTAEVVKLPNGQKISYKSQDGRSSVDMDRLRKDHPQIAAEYTTKGAPFRTLRFGKAK